MLPKKKKRTFLSAGLCYRFDLTASIPHVCIGSFWTVQTNKELSQVASEKWEMNATKGGIIPITSFDSLHTMIHSIIVGHFFYSPIVEEVKQQCLSKIPGFQVSTKNLFHLLNTEQVFHRLSVSKWENTRNELQSAARALTKRKRDKKKWQFLPFDEIAFYCPDSNECIFYIRLQELDIPPFEWKLQEQVNPEFEHSLLVLYQQKIQATECILLRNLPKCIVLICITYLHPSEWIQQEIEICNHIDTLPCIDPFEQVTPMQPDVLNLGWLYGFPLRQIRLKYSRSFSFSLVCNQKEGIWNCFLGLQYCINWLRLDNRPFSFLSNFKENFKYLIIEAKKKEASATPPPLPPVYETGCSKLYKSINKG